MEKAKNNPSDLSGLLTKDFNVRDTIKSAWLTFDDINNEETFDIQQFRNCYAIGGADLSVTTDLSCATLLFVDKDTKNGLFIKCIGCHVIVLKNEFKWIRFHMING